MPPVNNRQCSLCCDRPLFSRRSNLKRHGVVFHQLSGEELALFMDGVRDNRSLCDICKKTVADLARHLKTRAHRRKASKVAEAGSDSGRRVDNEDSDDSDFPDSSHQRKKRRVMLVSSDEESSDEESSEEPAKVAAEEVEKATQGRGHNTSDEESREDPAMPKDGEKATSDSSGEESREDPAKAEESEKATESCAQDSSDEESGADAAKTTEEFFDEFKKFCMSDLGNIKESSFKLYKDKLVIFEEFLKTKDEHFGLGKLISMQSPKHFQELPECSEWIQEHFDELASKEMALNAFKKLVDLLKFKVCTLEHKVDRAVSTERTGWLDRRKSEAAYLAKSIGAKRQKERCQKKWEAQIDNENTENQPVPMDELHRLACEYRKSDKRKQMYSRMIDMKKACETMTVFEIRSFVICDMYVECGGLRPDALLNMKLHELFNAEDVQGSDMYSIKVFEHKTAKCGHARVMVSHATLTLAKNYVTDIRPMICGQEAEDEDAEAFVFVTKTGKRLQSLKQSFEWFLKQVNSAYKIVPYDFRRLLATLGQSSDDPKVREKFPACMNQSRSTAERYYVSETYQQEEHAKLKDLVWGASSDLPAGEGCSKDFEIRSVINKRAKAKKAALKTLKKGKHFRRRTKCFFSPEDVEIIKVTFQHLKYSDGSRIANLSTQEYKSAYEKCEGFKAMVDERIKERDPEYVEKAVKNSYRWHCAKKFEEKKKKLSKK